MTPTDAILALNMPPLVTETAIGLVEGWIQRYGVVDSEQTTLLVETPFVVEIDEHALLVGISDRVAWSPEAQVVFGCSWKTTRESSRWWDEAKFLEENKRSPQWRFETLAIMHGSWLMSDGFRKFKPVRPYPPFILRGAVKSAIPEFWPANADDGIFQLANAEDSAVWGALNLRVAAVRAMKALNHLPWQLPGIHCTTFNTKCEFWDACGRGDTSIPKYVGKPNEHDAIISKAVEAYRPGFGSHPDDLIFTPTNYMLSSSCVERWRRRLQYPTESSQAQLVGTSFHAGVSAFYENELPMARGDELDRYMTTHTSAGRKRNTITVADEIVNRSK